MFVVDYGSVRVFIMYFEVVAGRIGDVLGCIELISGYGGVFMGYIGVLAKYLTVVASFSCVAYLDSILNV